MARYPGGQPAYRVTWEVRLLRWLDGTLLNASAFQGQDLPDLKRIEGPEYGGVPADDLAIWVFGLLAEPTSASSVEPSILWAGKPVTALSYSPDGRWLASVGDEGEAHL